MSHKKKGHSVASFQEDWLTKEEFNFWLRKLKKTIENIWYCLQ